MSIHRLAVAEIISRACVNAHCALPLAGYVWMLHRQGRLHEETDDLIERHGSVVFADAHWLADLWLEAEVLGL